MFKTDPKKLIESFTQENNMAYTFQQEGSNVAVFQDGQRISTTTPQNATTQYGYGTTQPNVSASTYSSVYNQPTQPAQPTQGVSNWQLSPWTTTCRGAFSQTPTLSLGGQNYSFDNPQKYID